MQTVSCEVRYLLLCIRAAAVNGYNVHTLLTLADSVRPTPLYLKTFLG